MKPYTKAKWLDILHNAIKNIKWVQILEWGHVEFENNPNLQALFILDIIGTLAIATPECEAELIGRMNTNQPKNLDALSLWIKWDTPTSPIRNFLLTRYIDYPTQFELDNPFKN